MDNLIRTVLEEKATEVEVPATAWAQIRQTIPPTLRPRLWPRLRARLELVAAAAALLLIVAIGALRQTPNPVDLGGGAVPAGLTVTERRIADERTIGSNLLQLGKLTPADAVPLNGPVLRQRRLVWANQLLNPLGFSLAQEGGGMLSVYRGDELLLTGFSSFSPVTVSERGDDFLFLASIPADRYWLVSAAGAREWEPTEIVTHRFQPPVYVGNDLVDVRWEQELNAYTIWRGGQRVFTVPQVKPVVGNEVKRLAAWDGHWVLEMADDVYIDGESLSKQLGYDSVFGWQLIADRPLYFFQRGGKVGIAYDGQVLPYQYEQVLHNLCCEPASLNPYGDELGLRFFGLRQGEWYRVAIQATGEGVAQLESDLAAIRRQVEHPVYVPTAVPAALTLGTVRQRDGLVEMIYRTEEGSVGLHVLNGPAGCCLDSDPRKAVGPTQLRGGLTGYFLVNQPEFGGPILWWVEQGTYVAISGPQRSREELVTIAESMSP